MGRRAARETAMKLLYQLEIQKDDRDTQVDEVLDQSNFNDNDIVYIKDIISGIYNNYSYINKIIEDHSKGWNISRIPKVEVSILRLGIYEISFRSDIPLSVSINEAVDLAKKYSGDEAGSFINGILGKITKLKSVENKE